MNKTADGYEWTPEGGLKKQLPTTAAVQPPSNLDGNNSDIYDVIVIGAGYSGLVACRDLTLSGAKVLLLEAKDRIGGRTFTSSIDGHLYELGGTYIHWMQPNVWREITRYGLHKRVDATVDLEKGLTSTTLRTPSAFTTMSMDQQSAVFASALEKFVNVDGMLGRMLLPFPFDPLFNPEAAQFDQATLKDRLDEIRSDLSDSEYGVLASFLAVLSGVNLEEAGLFGMLQTWALCGYSAEGVMALCALFKLRDGQSFFAQKFFDEAAATNDLAYAFGAPVAAIDSRGKTVQVQTVAGQVYQSHKVICTVPHNVLSSITIIPPFVGPKLDVLSKPHVTKGVKIHADVQPPELRTWMGFAYPDYKLTQAAGEAITPAGNARLTCFGPGDSPLRPDANIEEAVSAVKILHTDDIDVQRLVFHDWNTDKYTKGAWSWFPPGMATTRDIAAMREPHDDAVYFASADWAEGWRGFIDGAIQEGVKAAKAVKEQLALRGSKNAV
ncbi:hypothetical protein K4F52_003024 [Lecanicillium sp. MT-2017a]|nr:hypothetical protein K4F52_003024 [Lecanicillium sp. MT-2017a]